MILYKGRILDQTRQFSARRIREMILTEDSRAPVVEEFVNTSRVLGTATGDVQRGSGVPIRQISRLEHDGIWMGEVR